MLIKELYNKKLISPPSWLIDNTHYLTVMGSVAYGVSEDSSDYDLYGFCIPPKNIVFPCQYAGEIIGFGRQIKRFEQWEQVHVMDSDALGGKGREYDFSVYNIVKYFQLLMENNPNILDSIFTSHDCILHSTQIANHLRENRKLFLHKGSWFKFKGYAYSMKTKIMTKKHKGLDELKQFEKDHGISHNMKWDCVVEALNMRSLNAVTEPLSMLSDEDLKVYGDLFRIMHEAAPNRSEKVKSQEYDYKFSYHLVRLLNEIEQILIEGDLDLRRNREQLKSIRRGEWTLNEIGEYFDKKEKELETLYTNSTLRHSPDEHAIKKLLLECLELHYGSLEKAVVIEGQEIEILRRIKEMVERY